MGGRGEVEEFEQVEKEEQVERGKGGNKRNWRQLYISLQIVFPALCRKKSLRKVSPSRWIPVRQNKKNPYCPLWIKLPLKNSKKYKLLSDNFHRTTYLTLFPVGFSVHSRPTISRAISNVDGSNGHWFYGLRLLARLSSLIWHSIGHPSPSFRFSQSH